MSGRLPPAPSEAQLRDYLAERLDLIEVGLTLIKKEYHLPNTEGASGFIDILARGRMGELVIIELKRADQSARQALHELKKYVGLLAADRGVRVDQLRCVLLSTTWHELLIPFARFVRHVDYPTTGRLLHLDERGTPIGSSPMVLPSPQDGLETCPFHLILLYTNPASRNGASRKVAETLVELSANDYITLELDYAGSNSHVIQPFALYIVLAEFTAEMRELVRKEFPEDCEEEPDDPWWHEQLVQSRVVAMAEADSVETGSPAQFGSLEDWSRQSILGHGKYLDSDVWPANELLKVASGAGQAYSLPFVCQVTVSHRPAWLRMRQNLMSALLGAGEWPGIVSAVLDELEQKDDLELMVLAYAPNDILGSLDRLARTGLDDCMPRLIMEWKDGAHETLIGGRLEWDGETRVSSLEQVLRQDFGGYFWNYLVTSSVGGLAELDASLCQIHGLRYVIGESTIVNGSEHLQRLELDGNGSLRRTEIADSASVWEFLQTNADYVTELSAAFDRAVMRP